MVDIVVCYLFVKFEAVFIQNLSDGVKNLEKFSHNYPITAILLLLAPNSPNFESSKALSFIPKYLKFGKSIADY